MNHKFNFIVVIIAFFLFSAVGMAQTVPKPTVKATTQTSPKSETLTSRPIDKRSPELRRAFADKKFLDACEILAIDGEMFLADTARISTDGKRFSITFSVVNERNRSGGRYKQLVYSFDGKESGVTFKEKNDKYVPVKTSGDVKNLKLKWPPDWFPSRSGGTLGSGGGFSWGPWTEVKVECRFDFFCPGQHIAKMRLQERSSISNPHIKQTRWILFHCYCT